MLPQQDRLQQQFSFRWSPSRIKYLGTLIHANLWSIFEHIFLPVYQEIKVDLYRWNKAAFDIIASWKLTFHLMSYTDLMPPVFYNIIGMERKPE